MTKLRSPQDIQYLSFQGGGGLGFAYVGAVSALESLGVLPMGEGHRPQVAGVSGTSAGAITAMLLALGCTSKDIEKLFKDKGEFERFYDDPLLGKCRGLTPTDYSAVVKVPGKQSTVADFTKAYLDFRRQLNQKLSEVRETINGSWLRTLDARSPSSVLLLVLSLGPLGNLAKEVESIPLLKKFLQHSPEYLYSLTNDRGLFTGIAMRAFLQAQVRSLTARNPKWSRNPPVKDAAKMTFSMMKTLTGVDFAVVATNISQRKSVTFSARTTPEFPVVEAVAMSACFPVVYKPVYIDAPPSDPVLGPHRGLWLDGGILNNIPLHAFDNAPRAAPRGQQKAIALHPGMLALRLLEGAPRSSDGYSDPMDQEYPLAAMAGDLFETIMVPGREGQFLTPEEHDQSISLFTYDLYLLDFTPPEYRSRNAVADAREAIINYFK